MQENYVFSTIKREFKVSVFAQKEKLEKNSKVLPLTENIVRRYDVSIRSPIWKKLYVQVTYKR